MTDHDQLNCIQTYLALEPRAEQEYQRLLHLPENTKVQEVEPTWADKIEGKGEVKALHSLLLLQLDKRFGPLPEAVKQQLESLHSASIKNDNFLLKTFRTNYLSSEISQPRQVFRDQ